MNINARIEITIGAYRLLYSTINVRRYRIVRGKNGFVQFGRMAFIWGVYHG
jgi:hypothetical protein